MPAPMAGERDIGHGADLEIRLFLSRSDGCGDLGTYRLPDSDDSVSSTWCEFFWCSISRWLLSYPSLRESDYGCMVSWTRERTYWAMCYPGVQSCVRDLFWKSFRMQIKLESVWTFLWLKARRKILPVCGNIKIPLKLREMMAMGCIFY